MAGSLCRCLAGLDIAALLWLRRWPFVSAVGVLSTCRLVFGAWGPGPSGHVACGAVSLVCLVPPWFPVGLASWRLQCRTLSAFSVSGDLGAALWVWPRFPRRSAGARPARGFLLVAPGCPQCGVVVCPGGSVGGSAVWLTASLVLAESGSQA